VARYAVWYQVRSYGVSVFQYCSKALSTLASRVAEFGNSRRFRRQSPKTATVTEFGVKLSPNSVWTGLKYDFEYENFMSLNCQCIQRYYWSSVGREDAEKALALLELLFVRSGRISAE